MDVVSEFELQLCRESLAGVNLWVAVPQAHGQEKGKYHNPYYEQYHTLGSCHWMFKHFGTKICNLCRNFAQGQYSANQWLQSMESTGIC